MAAPSLWDAVVCCWMELRHSLPGACLSFGSSGFEELWHNFANLRNFVDFLPFSVDKALVLRLFQSLLLYRGV